MFSGFQPPGMVVGMATAMVEGLVSRKKPNLLFLVENSAGFSERRASGKNEKKRRKFWFLKRWNNVVLSILNPRVFVFLSGQSDPIVVDSGFDPLSCHTHGTCDLI